jgi:hypothetical protein
MESYLVMLERNGLAEGHACVEGQRLSLQCCQSLMVIESNCSQLIEVMICGHDRLEISFFIRGRKQLA